MREENDSMGKMKVPDDALYGASTQRAVLKFPISHEALNINFISAVVQIKWAAAVVNGKFGIISKEKSDLISLQPGKYLKEKYHLISCRYLSNWFRYFNEYEC